MTRDIFTRAWQVRRHKEIMAFIKRLRASEAKSRKGAKKALTSLFLLSLCLLPGCTIRGEGFPRFLRKGEAWGWHGPKANPELVKAKPQTGSELRTNTPPIIPWVTTVVTNYEFKTHDLVMTNAVNLMPHTSTPRVPIRPVVTLPPPEPVSVWSWDVPQWPPFVAFQMFRSNTWALSPVTWLERTTSLSNPVWLPCSTNVPVTILTQKASAVVTNTSPQFLRIAYGWKRVP